MRILGALSVRKALLSAVWLGIAGLSLKATSVEAASDAECSPYSAQDSDEFWYVSSEPLLLLKGQNTYKLLNRHLCGLFELSYSANIVNWSSSDYSKSDSVLSFE